MRLTRRRPARPTGAAQPATPADRFRIIAGSASWALWRIPHSAHILRDLAAVAEVDRYKPWADAMAGLLVDAKRRCDRAREQGRDQLPRGQRQLVRARYDALVADFFAAHPPPPAGWRRGSYERDAHNLAVALRDHRHEVLRFVADLAVPFDNNQGEVRHEVARCEWARRREGQPMTLAA